MNKKINKRLFQTFPNFRMKISKYFRRNHEIYEILYIIIFVFSIVLCIISYEFLFNLGVILGFTVFIVLFFVYLIIITIKIKKINAI